RLCSAATVGSDSCLSISLLTHRPPSSTLFPYTTLFRSCGNDRPASTSSSSTLSNIAESEPFGLMIGRIFLMSSPNSSDSNNASRSEEHTSELQSRENLVCRLLLEKKKKDNEILDTDKQR